MLRILIFLLVIKSLLYTSEELFELESFNFSMENDAVIETDLGYTHGGRTSLLFFRGNTNENWLNIPFTSYNKTNNFISFAYANQMFTPYDLNQTELISDDRPYAGYSYIELGLHQSSINSLDSLTLQIGVIGPKSKMQNLQTSIHNALDVKETNGWDNQLGNEYIFQLNYIHKWRLKYRDIYGLNSILVPYSGANLGNKSIKASSGVLYRVGKNIPKDFGINSMDEGSYSSIPTHSKSIVNDSSNWSSYLNFALGTNLVFRDIFLDGNTFKDSHSVDKNIVNIYGLAGITLRYKSFLIDFFHSYYSKEYEQRGLHKQYKGYSSLIFTYNFE